MRLDNVYVHFHMAMGQVIPFFFHRDMAYSPILSDGPIVFDPSLGVAGSCANASNHSMEISS